MAFVLDDIVVAATAAKAIATALRGVADTLKGGPLGGNAKEKKAELDAQVQKMETTLDNVGTLARMGTAYAESQEDVLSLLFLCRRAEKVAGDYAEDCRDKSRPGHDTAWRVLETLFDSMDLDVVHRVKNQRQAFYDQEDNIKITGWLDDFDKANAKRATSLRMRATDELRREMADMVEALDRTEALLKNTLYVRILKTLERVGA